MWVEKHRRSYRIRDLIAGKQITIRSGYPTKTAARAALAALVTDRMRGDALVPRGGRLTLADWVAVWLPAYSVSLRPSARASEPARVRNHVLPLLGAHRLEEIDALTVQTWVARLLAGEPGRKPLSVKTVHNCHGVLHTVLAGAVDQRLIRSNPCASTKLPKRVHREMRFLTDPEVGRLLTALPAHWRPMVLLLVATGMRWGEAAALRVGRVDLLASPPRARILEAMTELSGSAEIIFHEPKTERSRRTVSFPLQVAAALAGSVAGKPRDALVFTAPRGGPARTRNFRRTWLKACAAAGLAGLRVHDLRHTHAAMLIAAGVPLTAIQRRLGHSSIAVTSDLYGHLRQEVDEGLLAAVETSLLGVDLDAMAGEPADGGVTVPVEVELTTEDIAAELAAETGDAW